MTKQAKKDAFAHLRDASEVELLEAAARSRSEADWIVGMNATRAATIRLRSSFDGAVSLGRVQTPTLAILARREEEIRAFTPEPYWLVDAEFAASGERVYEGRYHAGAQPRLASAEEAARIVEAVQGGRGTITKLEKTTRKERAPLLYDLTTLQRDANTRFGFSARRTLAAAQRLYEEHKALTYPRTSSRFLPSDMVPEIKPTAAVVGTHREYARASAYVTGLDVLPLGRVIDDDTVSQTLPKLERGEAVATLEVGAEEKVTKPPRRYSDASLLAAMETAGKLVDDDELREAMKDSGIGTPATRAAIIERLIDVGYIEREGRALVCTEKGLNVIRLLADHPLTSPGLTGDWDRRLALIEQGTDSRDRFMRDIAGFADSTVHDLDAKLKDVRIPRANLGPCPVCGHAIVENRKGFSCWSREDPGCGFVIWKSKAGKNLGVPIARELIQVGFTEKPVTGFKGRSG